jgi:hypothetical protein
MNLRSLAVPVGVAVLALTAALSLPAAGEEPAPAPGGMPASQKKVEHALAKALVGAWSIDHASEGAPPGTQGTARFALALNGTALVEEYDMGPMFAGHGVYKFGDDGKTVSLWWFDTLSPVATHFVGTATEKGFEMKASDGLWITLSRTATGYEFRLGTGPEAKFTDRMTRQGAGSR